jgi:hypothetical protein
MIQLSYLSNAYSEQAGEQITIEYSLLVLL